MNLKTKSVSLVSFCCITILVVSFGFLHVLNNHLSTGVATMYAKEQVDNNRSRILHPLKQELILARKLAQSTTLRNWLSHENKPELQTAALIELEDYRQFFSDQSYFCAILESGHYYFNDKNNSYQNAELRYTLDPDNPDDFWFYRTLEKGQDYELNVDYDEKLKVTKVWINVVVRDGNRPIGIVGTGVDLSDFINSVIIADQPGVTNFYIDNSGAIQAHNNESYIDFRTISKNESERKTIFQHLDTQEDADALHAAIARLQSGQNTTEVFTSHINGAKYLLGVGAIPDISWYNITLLDSAAIIGSHHSLPFFIATCIALLLLSITLTMLFNRFVVKRINQLNLRIQNFSQGNKVTFSPIQTQDEIGHLETSFQEMALTLQDHTENLETSVAKQTEELTEKNTQLNLAYQSIQRIESRRRALNEISRDYLTNGNLEQSLKFLVENAAKAVGAQGGRFIHCAVVDDAIKVTSVTNVCWAEPNKDDEDPQLQQAFAEYAQTLLQSSGALLISTLADNKTVFLTAEQYLASRSLPLPDGHPPIESLALTPISIREKMFGVIALANFSAGFGVDEETGLDAFAAEAALLIHADSREVARAAAEEAARLRSTFLANMSHELHTPLNIIIGMNKLLQEMSHSTAQKNYLDKIDFSAQQLLELITDVLDLSEISANKELHLKETPFQPEQFFYSIAQMLAFKQDKRNVELHVDISQDIPPALIGDTLRLSKVLNNLISNALKFTPQGNATLQVTLVEKTAEQVQLGFSIKDTGIGITAKQLEKIFKPFVQVDDSTTRTQGGSGLGLTISQQLCQHMGGELSVESTPGQGSHFYFTLPFKLNPTASQEKLSFLPDTVQQGVSVLVVNSCSICGNILPPMLETMHFKADIVTSSTAALQRLNDSREKGNPYQHILIGLFLDDMTGAEFAQHLKNFDSPDLNKILLANPADVAGFSEQMTSLDVTEVIAIPASPSDLFGAMAKNTATTSAAPLNSANQPAYGQQIKILLVDDNEMGRELGRALLENIGINVVEAKNGLEAVDLVESDNFDLVLMDIQMPVLDGLDATRAIRALNKKDIDNLPIIAMTAHSSDEHQTESLAAGMNGHITKPIELEILYAELRRWLPESKQPATNNNAPEKLSTHVDLETALPGIDVKAGIHRAVGDRQLYVDLLKKFLEQFSTTAEELQQELQQERHEAAILRVHSLKGIAGNLGATQLQNLAGELEEQLSKKKKPLALKAMLEEHKNFLALLQQLPQLHQPVADTNKSSGSKAELLTLLEQMLSPLKSLQAHGVKPLLSKIQEKTWAEEYRDPLLQLEDLVSRYQFNPAAELVQNLLKKGED